MHSVVSGPYFNLPLYSRHTKLPGWKCARPRRCTASAGHGHVPGGSAPVLAAGAGRSQLQVGSCGFDIGGRMRRRGRPGDSAPAAAVSRALTGVAIEDVFFAAAVHAGGTRRGHVPRARRHRFCGPLLRRGRPSRWRPRRPRLRRHCRRRNSIAGKLPKAHQIMRNAATCKMNRYLCSAKVGERWESLDPLLMQICRISQ